MKRFTTIAAAAALAMISSPSQAILEIPANGAWVSGIGTISGWWCDANQITIEIDGGAISTQAAYGTERADTAGACGDSNNGYGLLFNWNLLSAGEHTVRAFADGVQFAEHTVFVGTIGQGDFATGLSGQFTLPDFPTAGTSTTIVWQESAQNFVISGTQQGTGGSNGGTGGGSGINFGDGTECEDEIAAVVSERGQPQSESTINAQGATLIQYNYDNAVIFFGYGGGQQGCVVSSATF